jgi:pimeloyl-ACP methyl ester carboxylesterase
VPDGWHVDWTRFGVDTVRVAEAIAPAGGLVGVGHSMGASSLLMAAHARPALFRQLTLFEPIAHRPATDLAEVDMRELPIVQGAFRRRRRFPSRAEARANYADKPPLSVMRDDVLTGYVEHGFRDVTEEDGSAAVELCCSPEIEGGIFLGGRDNGVWSLLAEIDVPTLVIGGAVHDRQPSAGTAAIADELPHGEYVLLEHQTHLGPFSHPEEFAALVPG